MRILKNWTGVVPWIIGLIIVWTIANVSLKNDYKTGVIQSDARGYYAYLPAVFIYKDLNFRFFYTIEREKYYDANYYYQYLRVHNNKTINKYYAGTALCLVPFFIIGHVVTLLTNYPADGYSYYYTLFTHIGALFYLLLGLFGLRKLLRTFLIDEKKIALVLIAFVFGTNLFYYVLSEFAMSHVYSFALISWFSYYVRKYFMEQHSKYFIFSMLLLGLITLIRPLNLIVLFSLPFLAGSRYELNEGFKLLLKRPFVLFLGIIGFAILVFVQLLIYKISTGDFMVYSYQEEGFNFLSPQIWNFLVSYRKGMFLYTPLLLISVTGFYFMFRSNRYQAISLFAFLLLLVYVLSSWHMWYYGGSFSQRVMIDFFAFFAILLSTAWMEIRNRQVGRIFTILILLAIVFCQIQTYQYRRMQIHWSDMDKGKYWEVFMRVDKL